MSSTSAIQDLSATSGKQKRRPPLGKYRNKKTWYNGVEYDSGWEAQLAETYDVELAAGRIARWERQVDVIIIPEYVDQNNRRIIGVAIRLDFVVHHHDGTRDLVDAKGMKTKEWIIKWKQLGYLASIGTIKGRLIVIQKPIVKADSTIKKSKDAAPMMKSADLPASMSSEVYRTQFAHRAHIPGRRK